MFDFTKFKQIQYSNQNYKQNRCNSTEYLYLDLFKCYIPLVSSKNWNKIKNSKMSLSNKVKHLEVANLDLLLIESIYMFMIIQNNKQDQLRTIQTNIRSHIPWYQLFKRYFIHQYIVYLDGFHHNCSKLNNYQNHKEYYKEPI